MNRKKNITRFALPGVLLIGAILASFFLGCERENKLADIVKDGDTQPVSIPQIDTVIPAKTETATFALG